MKSRGSTMNVEVPFWMHATISKVYSENLRETAFIKTSRELFRPSSTAIFRLSHDLSMPTTLVVLEANLPSTPPYPHPN
jgi:hypothetical protein